MFADFSPRPWPPPAVSGPPAVAPGTHVIVASLRAPPPEVFRLLADVEALPRWAPELCERVDLEGGGWTALTLLGEARCTLGADDASGSIELDLDPGPGGASIHLPIRVSAVRAGGTLVTVTQRRASGQSPVQFARQRRALEQAFFRLDSRLVGEAMPRPAAGRIRPDADRSLRP